MIIPLILGPGQEKDGFDGLSCMGEHDTVGCTHQHNIEFLLTRTAVLLAFPQIPKKAGSHAGEISFGIYCKNDDFSKNLIQWYRTFLVDSRFGWIRTESELNTVINELEEEKFQDRARDLERER